MKILGLILLFLTSCISCNYDIKDLQKKVLSYEELPGEVKKHLSEKSSYDPTIEMLLIINSDDSSNYRLERIKTIVGPWTAYFKLIDVKKGIVYKIDRSTPDPYIIYNYKLFIPNSYNIFSGNDFETCMYTEYGLK